MDGKTAGQHHSERLWRSLKRYLEPVKACGRRGLAPGSLLQRQRQHRALVTPPRQIIRNMDMWTIRLRRPAALPQLPGKLEGGEMLASPTYPQAPQPMKDLILMK
jgi:hypothetical protein